MCFFIAVNGAVTQELHHSLSVHLLISRRVHISSVTLEHLKGSYKVEPGEGQSRDSYLKEHNVVTYLVINPKVRVRRANFLFYFIFLYTVSVFTFSGLFSGQINHLN